MRQAQPLDTEDCPAWWNVDVAVAKYTLPILREFREKHSGYPDTMTPEEWDGHIDAMIAAFTLYEEDDCYLFDSKQRETLKKGMEAFAHYFLHLWD